MSYLCTKFRYWDETPLLNFTFMEGTEKIFCSNPSMDAMGMAAMMNGGMGANNWLNNPLS